MAALDARNHPAVAAVTAIINARMILMGAAIQPWLAGPKARSALTLFLLTDANWLIGSSYHAGGGRDVGALGSGPRSGSWASRTIQAISPAP